MFQETALEDKESQELDRKTLAVRSVMEMGYSRPVVEAVVEQLVDQGMYKLLWKIDDNCLINVPYIDL